MKAREINSTIRYTMWSVFKRQGQLADPAYAAAAALVTRRTARSTGLGEVTE